jgi:O-antigen ligase
MGLLRFTPLNKPIGVYIVVSLIATSLGIIEGFVNYRTAFFYFLKYIEYYLLFFMVVNHIKTMKQVKFFVFFMLITCVLVCFYAAGQIPAGGRLSAPFEGKGGEPNTFAGYLLLMMSVVGGLLLYPETRRQRIFLAGVLVFVGVVFLLTLSRGGWLGFFAMYAMFIILSKRFRIPLFAVFLVLVLSLPILMPQKVKDRFMDVFSPEVTYTVLDTKMSFSKSTSARIDAWRFVMERWKVSPLFGFGVSAGGVMDNQYSRVLLETGTVGFLAFVWLLIRLFRTGLTVFYLSGDNNFAKGLSLGFLAGLAGLLTHSFSAATFILIRIMEPFWFLTAMVVMLPYVLKPAETERQGGPYAA